MKPIISMLCLLALAAGSPAPYSLSNPPIRPDATLTPGGADYSVPIETVLANGFTKKVRDVTEAEKKEVFIRYFGSVPTNPRLWEIDHLCPCEMNGNQDVSNLWPQPGTGQWSFHVKDKLENWMRDDLRRELKQNGHESATALWHQYNQEIATDWIASYQKHIGGSP